MNQTKPDKYKKENRWSRIIIKFLKINDEKQSEKKICYILDNKDKNNFRCLLNNYASQRTMELYLPSDDKKKRKNPVTYYVKSTKNIIKK